MDLFHVIVILVAIGILVWLMHKAPFIDAEWKQYISYFVLVCVVLWLLQMLIGWPDIRIGRIRS